MRRSFLLAFACIALLSAVANAQRPSHTDTTGAGTSMTRPHPLNNPSIRDPGIAHVGIHDQWGNLAPKKNVVPSVTRIVGENLHLALFNYTLKEGKLESSVAIQLRPYKDKQEVEVHVLAIEQNGVRVVPTALSGPQTIKMKKQGAVLPFTVEMAEGDSLTCEMLFYINGQEQGRTRIRVDKNGLDFAAEKK
ncbi:MAG TPA: hypothetical protein VE262_06385 [Blastocatellia bacterium]|nr:hypothetical protein [Blastocatellia bacterium]